MCRIKYILLVLFSAIACNSVNNSTLEQVGGERFHYHSPITCIEDAGDSLLLGTAAGKIISFDLSDGDMREVYTTGTPDRTIYQIMDLGADGLLYSVQDEGLSRVLPDRSRREYLIEGKETSYSAYSTICDKQSGRIYAATSNGVYFWNDSDLYGHRIDTILVKDPNNGVSNRFYTLEFSSKETLRCAGENGVMEFYLDTQTGQVLNSSPTAAEHSGRILSLDNEQNCIDFREDESYFYNLSFSSVYVHEKSSGKHIKTIELPEKRHSQIKNKSCRAFSLVKGNYLYVAPGGFTLYKIPLASCWSSSEEVTQLCHGTGDEVYFLTAENDLFRLDVASEECEYLRSFEQNSEVYLVGMDGDEELIVLNNDSYYALSGSRMHDETALKDINAQKVGKILWNRYQNDTLYQGQVDKIRSYVRKGEWALEHTFEQSGDLVLSVGSDYYPESAEISPEGLYVNTLHDGFYELSDGSFKKDESLSSHKVKDFSVFDSTLFVLSDRVVTIKREGDYFSCSIDVQADVDRYFSDIISVSSTEFYAYAVDNIWCKGLYGFDGETGVAKVLLPAHTVNAALYLKDKLVVGGNMGLAFVAEDGNVLSTISVERPSEFKRALLNWHYPYGVALFVLLLVVVLIFSIFTIRLYVRFLARRKRERFEMQHEQAMNRLSLELHSWVNENYNSRYIRILADTLIKISRDPDEFAADIKMFKESTLHLDALERLATEIDAKEAECEKSRTGKKKEDLKKFDYDFAKYSCYDIRSFADKFHTGYNRGKEDGLLSHFVSRTEPGRVFLLLPVVKKTFFMKAVVEAQGRIKQEFLVIMQERKQNLVLGKLTLLEIIGLAGLAHLLARGPSEADS